MKTKSKIAAGVLAVLIGIVVISAIPSILESNYYASVNQKTQQMDNAVMLSNGEICDSKNVVGWSSSPNAYCKEGGFRP